MSDHRHPKDAWSAEYLARKLAAKRDNINARAGQLQLPAMDPQPRDVRPPQLAPR